MNILQNQALLNYQAHYLYPHLNLNRFRILIILLKKFKAHLKHHLIKILN